MSDTKQCACKDRAASECPGEWEPGCDLGANEKFAKAVPRTAGLVEYQLSDLVQVLDKKCAEQEAAIATLTAQLEEARKDAERLRSAGRLLSNVAFNMAQAEGHVISNTEAEMFSTLRKSWDAAIDAAKEAKP